jgi:membrane-associated phospholipid phosphatase
VGRREVVRLISPLVALILLLSVVSPSAAQSEPPPRYDPVWHTAIGAGGFVGAGLIEWVGPDADRCKWCGVDDHGAPDVPAIDNWARTHWRWTDEHRAGTISDITAAAAYAWPLVALSSVHGGIDSNLGRDLTATLSSVGVAQLATGVAKRAFRRSRPNVVFDGDPIDSADDVHSFFSGHTATTFAAVVSAGTIASRRGSGQAKWIWSAGIGLAGSTGYLRVAADLHFFTDALVAAAVGTAVGMLMPRLFDEEPSSVGSAPTESPQIVGMGPVTHLASRSAAPVSLQFGAGVRSIGVVGTAALR